ncbi:MAG: hypothetical protein R3D84_03520 [Paracoccaceae bacterium]
MPAAFRLFPNLRLGATAGATAGPDGRLVRQYAFEITDAAGQVEDDVTLDARFFGPGDVTGINPTEIARFEPEAGGDAFEPDYFPFVEFKSPDLPWRFSLHDAGPPSADGATRVNPWLVLIALRGDEFQQLGQGSAPCRRIRVTDAMASLPPLADRWAFAHVQMNTRDDAAVALAALADRPALGFSRLLCPRRLEPLTRYTLFLVPAYERGRLAGLGLDPEAETAPEALAWDASRWDPVELPVYASSTFRTDEGLNLEAQLRRLRSLDDTEADALADAETFETSHPGWFDQNWPDNPTLTEQRALMPTGYEPGNPGMAGTFNTNMARVLNEVIRGELEIEALDEADEDPLVAMPPYGFRYRDDPVIRAGGPLWVEGVNLDPRFRLVAQLGAACVRDHQEDLMAEAWRQYPEIIAANRELTRLRTAEALAGRITAQRFDRLPSDVALSLAEPFVPYARIDADLIEKSKVEVATLGGFLSEIGAPRSYISRDLRRAAARVQRRDPDTGAVALRMPVAPGDEDSDGRYRPKDLSEPNRAQDRLAARDPRTAENLLRDQGVLRPVERPPARRMTVSVPVGLYSSVQLHDTLRQRLTALPRAKADVRIRGRSAAERATGGGLFRAPRIPVPLVDYLLERNPETLMAGVRDMPDNTIAFFEENRSFVEAALLGACHEMNEELRWRGFPTDMRATVLPRFWNRGHPEDDTTKDDIGPIRGWKGALGQQDSPVDSNGKADIVVLIKGDVVRKLDAPLLRIDICKKPGGWDDADLQKSYMPVYSGKISPGLGYWGFDVSLDALLKPDRINRAYFVILEPPGRLRFGLDVGFGGLAPALQNLLQGSGGLGRGTTVVGRARSGTMSGGRALARALEAGALHRVTGAGARVITPGVGTGQRAGSIDLRDLRRGGVYEPTGVGQTDLEDWDDLTFGHLARGPGGYIRADQQIDTPSGSSLDLWGASASSATIARSFWQRPIAAVVPFKGVFDGK